TERTCGRVAVLREGKIAAQGSIVELTARGLPAGERYRMVVAPMDEVLLSALRETGAGVERVNEHLELSTRDLAQLNAVVDRVRERGGLLSELSPLRSSLEDVFVDLVRAEEKP
ncbi:MAG TPA: hypothetical protein VLO07_04960, partial [Thermoanaerobaculia bacterium]|nr:hypothetical protein [Thermoanaerobaculia bacterium]